MRQLAANFTGTPDFERVRRMSFVAQCLMFVCGPTKVNGGKSTKFFVSDLLSCRDVTDLRGPE
jgi:hypothetical protein